MANKPGKKPAKSKRADGTPKKRWTATERTVRGHQPRRSGGQRPSTFRTGEDAARRPFRDDSPRGETRGNDTRGDRTPAGGDRSRGGFDDRRSTDRFQGRDERPRGGDRFQGRSERPAYRADSRSGTGGDRFQGRSERPAYRADSRPGTGGDRFQGRSERPAYRADSRPGTGGDRFQGRSERPAYRADSRPGTGGDRFQGRSERPGYRADSRPRSAGFGQDPRPRDDRFRSREDRGSSSARADRDSRGSREDRGQRPDWRPSESGRSSWTDQRAERKRPYQTKPGFKRDYETRPYEGRPRGRGTEPVYGTDQIDGDTMEWTEPEAVEVDESQEATGGFAELGVHPALVKALASQGIDNPFPIQLATIADATHGRDVLGRGRTGSGKTLAFGLAMLTRLARSGGGSSFGRPPAAMVLVPTRELALQVADVLAPLARTIGLHLALVTGGMSYTPQLKAFERGVDIVVATPGRLIDLLNQGAADLSKILVSVLDEADQMADMGFMTEITTLLDATPADGQRMLFSATLDAAVDRLVTSYLNDPITHEVDSVQANVTTMSHQMLHVMPKDKVAVTAQIAGRTGRTLAFVRTQLGADRVAEQLRDAGIMAGALHGGMTQGARARTLDAFRRGAVGVLVATDVAARGIHVDDVSLVLQVDPPNESKDYTHRAGRTARAGESGSVVTLVLPHQRRQMARLAVAVGITNDIAQVTPGDNFLTDKVGEMVQSREPITEDQYRALITPQPKVRAPRANFRNSRGGGQENGRGWGGRATRVGRRDHH